MNSHTSIMDHAGNPFRPPAHEAAPTAGGHDASQPLAHAHRQSHACPSCPPGTAQLQVGEDRADGWELTQCSGCGLRWQRYSGCSTCRRWIETAR